MKIKKTVLKQWTLLFLIFFALALACFCNGEERVSGARIIIFHVNDMHANIDNFARVAWAVARERETDTGADVFFLNAGDNFSGNPIVDQYDPKGEPVRELLNRMGFDAMTLGNHEFDYGQEILKNLIEKATFPVLGANIKVTEGSFPKPRPYTILKTKKGIKIALLGLIQVEKDSGIPSTHPKNLVGLTFQDPIETALEYRYLKKESDVFIALTHLGFDTDEKLAGKMPELDVIIGGHSHTRVDNPVEINGVLIAQAYDKAKCLGRVEIIVKDGKVVKKSGKLINTADIEKEIPELRKMIAKFNDNPVLDQVVAELPEKVKGKLELGNLTTDACRNIHHLDVMFHNSGGIRSDELGKTVKLRDIYALHPFGNEVILFEMTPAEIRSLIANDYRKNKGLDLRVSGLRYLVTASLSHKVKAIELKDPQGRLLDENKTYKVGMNNYISATYTFDHQDAGKSLMVTLAETLTRYLKEGKNVCSGIDRLRAFETIAPGPDMTRIGETRVEISSGDDRFAGSSSAGNLAADALRAGTGADIAVYPGQLLHPMLIFPANTVFYKEFVRRLYDFSHERKAVTAQISGKDLQEFILKRSRYKGNADLQVSGITYTIYLDAGGKATSVDCSLPDGTKISDSALYKVSFNDYEFNNYYKLDSIVQSPTVSAKTVEQMVIDYIKSKRVITDSIKQERIKIISKNE
jgi:5'-nucleotidase/UDP-sugar diphosphatase